MTLGYDDLVRELVDVLTYEFEHGQTAVPSHRLLPCGLTLTEAAWQLKTALDAASVPLDLTLSTIEMCHFEQWVGSLQEQQDQEIERKELIELARLKAKYDNRVSH